MRGAGTSGSTHVYDAAGQNVLVATSDPVGGVVRRLTYSYDAADRRDGQVAPGPVATAWLYDAAGQLGVEARSGPTGFVATHAYDPAGNRVAQWKGAVLTTYAYDAANQQTGEWTGAAVTTYTHDGAGNRVTKDAPWTRTYYQWDAHNRLVAGEPVSGTVAFAYDGAGRRVERRTGSGGTRYVWDLDKVLQEVDPDDGTTERQYLNTQREFGGLVSAFGAGDGLHYGFDALGSTDVVLDDSGSAAVNFAYEAYGLTAASGAAAWVPGRPLPAALPSSLGEASGAARSFAWGGEHGYLRDVELDLYFLGPRDGRFYDPAAARFLTTDPLVDAGRGPNLYLYANNDPVNNTDPSGWDPLPDRRSVPTTESGSYDYLLTLSEFLYSISDEYRGYLNSLSAQVKADLAEDFAKAYNPKLSYDYNRSAFEQVLEKWFQAQPSESKPGPSENEVASEVKAPPPPQASAENLKRWQMEADKAQKARDARADGLLKEKDDDNRLRNKLSTEWNRQADESKESRRRKTWIGIGFRGEYADDREKESQERALGQLIREIHDVQNFEPRDGMPHPITEVGKQRRQQWQEAEEFRSMPVAEKLKEALKAAGGKIEGEFKQRFDEMIEGLESPEGLAMMAGLTGLGVAGTILGGPVAALSALIGYYFVGEQVLEISEGLYMAVAAAVGARSRADIDDAGAQLAKIISQLGTEFLTKKLGQGASKSVKEIRKQLKGKTPAQVMGQIGAKPLVANPPNAKDALLAPDNKPGGNPGAGGGGKGAGQGAGNPPAAGAGGANAGGANAGGANAGGANAGGANAGGANAGGANAGGAAGNAGGAAGNAGGAKPQPLPVKTKQNEEAPAAPKPPRSVDDILAGTTPGRATKGPTTQVVSKGGMGQANADFDALGLTNVKDISTSYGPGRTGTLSDGRQVTVRPGSTDGRPTLEIRKPNGRGHEIRYD